MPVKKINIAIDGPSGSGKSTTAKLVAKNLDYQYIDSGAMYRAVTWYCLVHQVNIHDEKALGQALEDMSIAFTTDHEGKTITLLNGEVVERQIRSMPVSEQVSRVSAIPLVRKAMVSRQQELGANKGVVMDGRDIGTHVFPDAELKIFLISDPIIRAERRWKELRAKGEKVTLEEVMDNLVSRDKKDSNRDLNPLRQAEDAILLDNSNMSIEDQVNFVLKKAKEALNL